MREIFTVIKFTMKEMIKRKSFIISTIIILGLILVGFNIPRLLKSISGEEVKQRILISDTENIFEGNLELLKQRNLNYEIINNNDSFDEIKQKIENEEIESAIIIENKDGVIKLRYIVESENIFDIMPEDLVNEISMIYSNLQISKLGLSMEQLNTINPNFDISYEQISEEKASGNVFVIMLMSIVLFYAIYFCAYQVSSSITTEKTSKIIETLVTSTTPKTIVLGKTIGIGIVGLIQMILIVTTAIISAKAFLDEELLNSVLDMSNITISLGLITIVYFILGYFAYALIYALTGSTVTKPEDIQSANTPVAILSIAGFYLAYFTMMNPTSNLNLIASILPISSPFCMPFRIMMGLATSKDILISIGLLILTIFIVAKVAIKIYSSAILNYGSKMSIKDLIKVYKDR